MFQKDIRIKFEKEFTHKDLGNVWHGREVVISPKQAQRFIDLKLAVPVQASEGGNQNQVKPEVKSQEIIKPEIKEGKGVRSTTNSKPFRGKRTSKNRK